jgi:hypothetical protein
LVTEMPVPRIAILLGAPLTEQNYKRTGIAQLSAHFEVVTIDCLDWLGRSTRDIAQDAGRWGHVVRVASAAELGQVASELELDYAIDFVGLGPITAQIQKVMRTAKVKFVVQKTGSLPVPGIFGRLRLFLSRSASPAAEPLESLPPAPVTGRLPALLGMILRRVNDGRKMRRDLLDPDIALLAGRGSLDSFTRRARKIIWIASNDAHLYWRVKAAAPDAPDTATPPYCLFIDDYLPHASDWKLLGLRPPVTAEIYYRSMARFFADLEDRLGLPVIIAAHPSSQKDSALGANFGGRQVISGQTSQLVLGSQRVMLHASTAVSFAVLGDKPTVFLTSDELEGSSYGLGIKAMAKSLGGPVLNIDVPQIANALPAQPSINRRKYARYVDLYLRTSEATEKKAWQAFSEYVLQNKSAAVD